jgi:glycosyltransferase involved in cell wall biosynthesis
VVGPGFRFLGGLSVYTCRLANALADDFEVSALLIRRLIPGRLYPGHRRVGANLTTLRYRDDVRVYDGIDWYWGPSLIQALRFLRRARPDVLILQWWTAAVAHSYLVLATAARRLGIPVVIEFHEVQDPGEAAMPVARMISSRLLPALVARASGAVVHSEHDRALLAERLDLAGLRVEVTPHGPYDHLVGLAPGGGPAAAPAPASVPVPRDGTRPAGPTPAARRDPPEVTRLLFFGLIRPYKGLEDLVSVFNGLDAETASTLSLTVVGETWEGWTLPGELIRSSPHAERVNFVNRYVDDREAAEYFADADVVVLPYRRGNASGPLQMAMSHGLTVVLYAVGGLVESVRDYEGAVLVSPDDTDALKEAILTARRDRNRRYRSPHSWERTKESYRALVDAVVVL